MTEIRYLDATTSVGRDALAEVMVHAYAAEVEGVPAEWALVRLADEVPVSFALVDPAARMEMPRGPRSYAFLADAATRDDRRRQGHFRGLVAEVLARLRRAGCCWPPPRRGEPLRRWVLRCSPTTT
jgi:GNAT superfamily N-acetyltransferase